MSSAARTMPTAAELRAALRCDRPGCPCQRPGPNGKTHCPSHDDGAPSLDIVERDGRVLLTCRAGCAQRDVLDALRRRNLWPERHFGGRNGHRANGHRPGPGQGRETRYELRDPDGQLVAVHVRRDLPNGDKVLWWEQPDGTRGLGGRRAADLPLYGIDRLNGAREVVVTEGEKAAAALQAIGVPAAATVTGAGGTPSDAALMPLLGRRVYLWPDNDPPGREHMARIGARLLALGANPKDVRVIEWPEAPPSGDAADFVAGGRDAGAVELLLLDAGPVPSLPTAEDAHRREDAHPHKLEHLRQNEHLRSICSTSSATAPGGPAVARAVARVTPRLLSLAAVQPEPVRWLWSARIPLGKLAVLDGDPGLGKSLLAIDLAARVSTGREMPDGTRGDLAGPASVVLLSAEDDPADTIRPRLDAAGGDPSRVVVLTAVEEVRAGEDGSEQRQERGVTLLDIEALRQVITATGARLVVIDPLMAYVGRADTHVDAQVRQLLRPLAELAQETGAAVLVIRHLNKTGAANPLYRGGGSIAFIGAARAGLLVARDPDDATGRRVVLATTKTNLSEPAPALAYGIEAVPHPTAGWVPRIAWQGESPHTARTLLAAPVEELEEERTAVEEAKAFLRDLLTAGPVPAERVRKEARQAGISDPTLRRAKALVGVRSVKAEFTGGWMWALPTPTPTPAPSSTPTPAPAPAPAPAPPRPAGGESRTNAPKVLMSPEDAHQKRDEHLRQDEHLRSKCSTGAGAAGGGGGDAEAPEATGAGAGVGTPAAADNGPCPRCGYQLVERTCWKCKDSICRGCGAWTGSGLRKWCIPCGLKLDRELRAMED